VLPLASVDIDCCFTPFEREELHTIPMHKPLTNMLSFVEDLRIVIVVLDVVPNVVDNVLFGCGTNGHKRNLYVTPENDVV